MTGESGEEEGDGSDSGEESVVDSVVVGEESADSDACVEVLSWCRCDGSVDMAVGRRPWCCEGWGNAGALPSISTTLGLTTVTVS